ncbi:MAG: L,D-transpeptidase [Candidatus Zixiibacteriota bacterium]
MKRWWWLIIVFLILAAGFVTAQLTVVVRKPSPSRAVSYNDSLLIPLPHDQKLAQKELDKIRSMLAKMKPPRPYIVIDTHANVLSLRTEDSVISKATCSTGSGGVLIDSLTGRRWAFSTPRGVFKVTTKLVDPWWRKPDWAFIEDGEDIPQDPSERLDPEMLGKYALGFGNDYYIHGTIYERLLGVSVTHGCVRLGVEDLEKLYNVVQIGTPVYIF